MNRGEYSLATVPFDFEDEQREPSVCLRPTIHYQVSNVSQV